MVVAIVLGVMVWLSIPPLLSRAMRRRGHDGGSWLVVGLLFGPVAVALAAFEVRFDVPQGPRILEAGRTGTGDLSILVVLEAESPAPWPMAALAELSPNLRRLGLAQILPKGGPQLEERLAEQALRRAATGLAHPEIALLFGRPDLAIAAHAAARAYDVVVTAHPDSLVSERLAAIGRVHWWGNDGAPVFGPGRLTADSLVPGAHRASRRDLHPSGSAGPPAR